MLVGGVFEQPTSVIFMGDGVWQLVGDGSKIDRKDTARALNALPMYDVEALYVDETSLELRGIVLDTIDLPVKVISTDKLTHLLHDHDIVVGVSSPSCGCPELSWRVLRVPVLRVPQRLRILCLNVGIR